MPSYMTPAGGIGAGQMQFPQYYRILCSDHAACKHRAAYHHGAHGNVSVRHGEQSAWFYTHAVPS